ncbi:unnamed protein product [Gordionus sp. m RMFG-2023]
MTKNEIKEQVDLKPSGQPLIKEGKTIERVIIKSQDVSVGTTEPLKFKSGDGDKPGKNDSVNPSETVNPDKEGKESRRKGRDDNSESQEETCIKAKEKEESGRKESKLQTTLTKKLGSHSISGALWRPVKILCDRPTTAQHVIIPVRERISSNPSYMHVTTGEDDRTYVEFVSRLVVADINGKLPLYTTSEKIYLTALDAPGSYQIEMNTTQVVDSMDMASADRFFVAGVIQGNNIASALHGKVSASLGFKISRKLNDNLLRVNNASFYGVGYILFFQRYIYELRNISPCILDATASALVKRRLDVTPNQENALADRMSADITEGRFVWFADELNAGDINVLGLIASGLPRFTTPERHDWKLCSESVTCEPIRMVLYASDAAELPRLRDASSCQIRSSLHRLADLRGDEVFEMEGWFRACMVVFGRALNRTEEGTARVLSDYMDSWLQIGGCDWPLPMDYNWLWRALSIAYPLAKHSELRPEINSLRSCFADEFLKLSVTTSTLLSIGVSVTLNMFNITGKVMNAMSPGVDASISLWLGSLFDNLRGKPEIPLIMQSAMQFLTDFTNLTFNDSFFIGRGWNLRNKHVLHWGENASWRGTWGNKIPYIVNPLCLSWIWNAWPDIWGIMGAPIEVDLRAELYLQGNGWIADKGSMDYARHAKEKQAFKMVSYGLHVVNALRQWSRATRVWAITWRCFTINAMDELVKVTDSDELQPTWVDVLGIAEIGSWLSYDWFTGYVLVPSIKETGFDAAVWTAMITIQVIKMMNAGISLPLKAMPTMLSNKLGPRALLRVSSKLHKLALDEDDESGNKPGRKN